MLTPQDFFDLSDFEHREIFSQDEAVWTALNRLNDYLSSFFRKPGSLSKRKGLVQKTIVIHKGEVCNDLEIEASSSQSGIQVSMKGEVLKDAAVILPGAYLANDSIIIGPGTIVEPGAFIKGPVIIGKNAEIRQGAYIRGDCIIGDRCVVGHTTEMKSSILLNGAKAAHFAYVGDSILGRDVNLGAGTKLANLKMIPGSITITADKKRYDTGRRKLGAILGDLTETGCNSVTSPGTLLGPGSIVYPGVSAPGGYYPHRTIIAPTRDSLRIVSSKR